MILMPEVNNMFFGVVENRMDPMQQGRIQVRVIGVHPFSKIQGDVEGMPVEDLPWMSVLQSSNSASVSGIGGPVTGFVEGSHVAGFWLDKYKTNGLVIGSVSGNMTEKPNPDEGFSDPNGVYPFEPGPDINPLNAGGDTGLNAPQNIDQDNNPDIGINPNPGNPGNQLPDDNPEYPIRAMVASDEGQKVKLYWDNLGYPTIGIGHLILYKKTRNTTEIANTLSKMVGRTISPSNVVITHAEMMKLFDQDLVKTQTEMRKYSSIAPAYNKVNRSRQMALENMAFQMGVGGLAKFKNSLALIAAGQWQAAHDNLLKSLWAKQTPNRARRVAKVILLGNLTPYGQQIKIKVPKSRSLAAFNFATMSHMTSLAAQDEPDYDWDTDWSVEPPVEDSNILFKEPPSSYGGKYPYVKATQTESGLTQEFDDTPDKPRYRLIHPSGTYQEFAPDGRTTYKTTGNQYDLVQGIRNTISSGGLKVNVGGDEVYYNMANIQHTVDGSRETYVQGNETLNIKGTGTIKVSGSLKIIVEGDADITVNGNANSSVSGNKVEKVGGSYTLEVGGAMMQKAASVTSTASGPYTIDGSIINLG